jgi:LysR family nod box-dependent transcriptional activator
MVGRRPVELNQFDLNLLVALDALLMEQNVTHAGMRMNLSQSAMSGALARLRRFFQDDLLVPVGRGMVLTPLAQELVEPVRDILLQVRGAIGTKPRFEPASSDRHFSIAVSDYVTTILIVDMLRQVKCEAPLLTFELRPIGKLAAEDLERGDLDFLISPKEYVSTVHPSEVLFDDTHTCIAWTKNSLVGATLSLDEYLTLGHVVVHVGDGGTPNYDERVLRRFNHKRRVEVSTPSFDLAPQLVVGTDRIATVTTRLAWKYAELLPLRLLPVPVEIPPMIEVLQWHKAHDQDLAHRWFRARLKEAVAKMAGPPFPLAKSRPQRGRRHRSPSTAGARRSRSAPAIT